MKLNSDSETKISVFDAKTHLSRLLREVQEGWIFTITHRGKPVAKLGPYSVETDILTTNDIITELHDVRRRIKGRIDIDCFPCKRLSGQVS